MKLPTLDFSRTYGEIHGERPFAEKYEQDGFLFLANGQMIEEALTAKDRARLQEAIDQLEALEAARAAFLKHAPNTDPALVAKLITADALKKPEPAADEPIDLLAWSKGERKYNFSSVTKAFREKYSQSPVNAKQGLEILAEHGVIPAQGGAPTIPSQQ